MSSFTVPFACSAALLVLLVLLSVAGVAAQSASPSPTSTWAKSRVLLCLVLPDNVDDLGWSFTANRGRLEAKRVVEASFPNATLDSLMFADVANQYRTPAEKAELLTQLLGLQCDFIVSMKQDLLTDAQAGGWLDIAGASPNVSFLVAWTRDGSAVPRSTLPNLMFILPDYLSGYFLAGVAAAMQTRNCVAMVVPFTTQRISQDAAAGFVMGVRYVNQSIPVHLAATEHANASAREIDFARMMVTRFGCDVVSSFSNTNLLNLWGEGQKDSADLLTTAAHSFQHEHVGDTVLISVTASWTTALAALALQLFRGGNFDAPEVLRYKRLPGVGSGLVTTSTVSSRARGYFVQAAVDAARAAISSGAIDLVCAVPAAYAAAAMSTPNVTYGASLNASRCRDPYVGVAGLLIAPNVVFHGRLEDRSECRAGTTANYDIVGGLMRLRCDVCPAGTFSARGELPCAPCPEGLDSEPGASACSQSKSGSRVDLIAGLTAGLGLPFIVLVITAILFVLKPSRELAKAPTSGIFYLVCIRISAPETRLAEYGAQIAAVIEKHDGYFIRSREQHLIYVATKQPENAMLIAIDSLLETEAAHQSAKLTDSGLDSVTDPDARPGAKALQIAVIAAIVYDEATFATQRDTFPPIVTVTLDADKSGYSYSGTGVDIVMDLSSQALPGELCVDNYTLDILSHFATENFLSDDRAWTQLSTQPPSLMRGHHMPGMNRVVLNKLAPQSIGKNESPNGDPEAAAGGDDGQGVGQTSRLPTVSLEQYALFLSFLADVLQRGRRTLNDVLANALSVTQQSSEKMTWMLIVRQLLERHMQRGVQPSKGHAQ